jgi:hypothetical protein
MMRKDKDLTKCLHIDHIVSIDQCFEELNLLGFPEEEIIRRAFHWSNHQPLIALDNLQKGSKPVDYMRWSRSQDCWVVTKKGKGKGIKQYDLPTVTESTSVCDALKQADIVIENGPALLPEE